MPAHPADAVRGVELAAQATVAPLDLGCDPEWGEALMLDLKYRPQDYSQFVVGSKAKGAVKAVRKRAAMACDTGLPLNLCFCGPSGIGKSSLARLVARIDLGADECMVDTLPSGKVNPGLLREIEADWHHSALFGSGWRVLVIEECHMLSAHAVNILLTLAEADVPKRAIILTTTTRPGELFGGPSGALGSRFSPEWLTDQGVCEPAARRLQEIARAEGVDGKPLDHYIRIVKRCKNNIRLAVRELERE